MQDEGELVDESAQACAERIELAVDDFLACVRTLQEAQVRALPCGQRDSLRHGLALGDAAIGTVVRLPSLTWCSTYLPAGSADERLLPGADMVSAAGGDDARALVEAAAALMVQVTSLVPPGARDSLASALGMPGVEAELRAFECRGVGYLRLGVVATRTGAAIPVAEVCVAAKVWSGLVHAVA